MAEFNVITGKKGDATELKGLYIFDINDAGNSYLILSGKLITSTNIYSVRRQIKLQVSVINPEDHIFELTPVVNIKMATDNLPEVMAQRYLFVRPRLYRIQKTLESSFLFSNSFSPVFVCHDISS
jgi:hypothetical protein